jgi:branched-chain amino acid transport system ATP-binding protein
MVEQNARAALEASDRGYVLSDGAARLHGPARGLLGDPAIAEIYLGGRRR